MVQKDVLLLDGGEHVAVIVLHPFRHAGREGGPEKIGAGGNDEFFQVGNAQHAAQFDHLIVFDAQFFLDQRAQLFGGPGGKFQTDHLAPAAAFQRGFKFAHQIFGLVFNFKIAVAQDAEQAMATVGVAGEEHVEMEEEKFLKRQEAVFAVFAGQRHKAGNLLGDGQQRLERAVVGFALQLQGQRKAGVGDEGEGMGRVNREGREHGKDVAQEVVFEKLQVAPGEFGAGGDQDAFGLHLAAQTLEHRLLHLHQIPRIGVNEGQLFGGAEAIFGGGGIARLHQRAQACDADGVKFIEVGG